MRIDKDDSMFFGLNPNGRGRAWTSERNVIEKLDVGDVLHEATALHMKAVYNIRSLRDGRRFQIVRREAIIHIKRLA